MNDKDRLIQVCAECGTACCWHGEFLCSDSLTAGLELRTVEELNNKKLENNHHYSVDNIEKIFGDKYPFGFKEQ